MSSSANNKKLKLKDIAVTVRGLVISHKQPCFLNEILNEHREFEGPIHFRALGYSSAEELLRDTGEFRFSKIGNQTCIAAIENDKSAHIACMVRQQKSSKPKSHKQARNPRSRSDQSWNRSSYTYNVYQNLPQRHRVNGFSFSNIRSANSGDQMLNSRAQSSRQNNNSATTGAVKQQDLRVLLNTKASSAAQQQQRHQQQQHQQQQTKMSNGSRSETTREPPKQPLQPQMQQKRPILGQNNNNAVAEAAPSAAVAAMQLLHNDKAVEIASSMILAQREHQQRQQQQQRTSLQNGKSIQNRLKPPSSALSCAGAEMIQKHFGGGGVGGAEDVESGRNKRYIKQIPQQQQQPVIPPVIFQFNPRLDPITSLSQYCLVRRCPEPKYSFVKSKFSRLYQCRVDVNKSIFSTYPNEYPNEHLAKIASAQKAIEKIQLEESRRHLPTCTESDEELIEKLYDEVLKHPHGIFVKNIPEWFETTFEHSLPEHWFSLVQTSKRFILESANEKIVIFANTETEEAAITIQMEGITLPWKEKHWQLLITHCSSTVEVWARLFGKEYSERFDKLMNDIDNYMQENMERPLSVAAKQFYLVQIAECWHRVRVEELDKMNGTALCFFIDFGDVDCLTVSKLHICNPQFLRLPAQAVPFSLFGLEDFAGTLRARRHLIDLLSSKSVMGEILTKESDFYAADSNSSGKIQVVLYDTSKPDVDINLNPMLLQQICNDMSPPELKSNGVTSVVITHINDAGDIYLQVMNTDLKYVQKLIQQLVESKFKREQHKISRADLKTSNLFLICEDNGSSNTALNWYRGALVGTSFGADEEEFDIFYVDHGKIQSTHISKIFRLDSLSTALSKYPRQAVKVRLHNIPEISSIIVGRMHALLPSNCDAMVKVIVPGITPLVCIFKRDNGTICTINDVLRIEHELEICEINKNGCDNTGSTSPTENVELPSPTTKFVDLARGLTFTSMPSTPQKSSTSKLRNYEAIPNIDDYFEVRVTMSANPSNFTIQPYQQYPQLRDLMMELQEYCESNDEFIPADMVQIGQAYAAKNPDGFYHRITVVNTYNCEMIHVCFCDFGDIAILQCDQLKILPTKFRQLPKMAIQAKLYNIRAAHGDWTQEDCVRFRALTVGKKFVSVIKQISYDELTTPPTSILELELIDVATNDDTYISEVLLSEGRAIREYAN